MNSLFSSDETNAVSSEKHIKKLARWEKDRNNGKWFWIFRRTSIWFVSLLMLFALISSFAPVETDFSGMHFFAVVFMIGGFVLDSHVDWSQMEKIYQSGSLTND